MTSRTPLSNLLAEWHPHPADTPDFAAGVHARLAAAPPTASLVARVLRFPATLPLTAAFAVIMGVASALTLNRTQHQERMADAYARSIDPVQLTAAGHDHHP